MNDDLSHVCGIEGCRNIPTRDVRIVGTDVSWMDDVHNYGAGFVELSVRVCKEHFGAIIEVNSRWLSLR